MTRTVRYRLRANNRKKYYKLSSTAGACRFAWNYFNGEMREDYQKEGYQNSSHAELGNRFTELRKDVNYNWLKEVSSYIVRHSLNDLTLAYKRFYSKLSELPGFKSKYKTVPSFPVNYQSVKVSENKWLRIFGIGWFKLIGSNPYPEGIFKSGRIKKECGKWYAYLSFEIEDKEISKELSVVAIDRNSRQVTCSDGSVFELPDITPQELRKVRYQRKLSRQIKFSNRWKKTKLILQRISKKIANIYKNWRHQISKKLSGLYNLVVLEDLHVQEMTSKDKKSRITEKMKKKKVKKMRKNILDTSWYDLENLLEYKCGSIEKVSPQYTSQTCSRCNYINSENRKGDKFKCLNCGFKINSDSNASFNIFDIFVYDKLMASGNGATGQGTAAVNCQFEHSVLRY